jgi:hypothetical protein
VCNNECNLNKDIWSGAAVGKVVNFKAKYRSDHYFRGHDNNAVYNHPVTNTTKYYNERAFVVRRARNGKANRYSFEVFHRHGIYLRHSWYWGKIEGGANAD